MERASGFHIVAVLAGTVLVLASPSAADDSVPDMLEKAMPAVVTVAVRKSTQGVEVKGLVATDAAYEKALDLGDAESSGSGFLIELNGKKFIVTNAHVVQSASGSGALVVYSINQTKYEVSVAALDSLYDLAVLSFNEPPGPELAALVFRSGTVRVGEPVYAIGNPLGNYPYSVAVGIIGGKNRRFPDLTGKFGYLQSSAPLSRGNSGGPLLGADGQVVGVSTRIGIDVQGRQSFQQAQLNFALEASIASRIIGEMLGNGGRLHRAFLGIQLIQDVESNTRPAREGDIILASVLPGSPAAEVLEAKAGYKIRRIGRLATNKADDALQALEQTKPGEAVRIELSAPKSDKIEVVTIKAASLTDENAAAIAAFLLKKETAASAGERDGGVTIRTTSGNRPTANASMRLKFVNLPKKAGPSSASWLSKPVTQLPPEMQIVAAGKLNSDDEDLYRVRSMRDLGVAVKLTAMSGKVDFVYAAKGQSDPGMIQLTFSDQPDVLRRTLFY